MRKTKTVEERFFRHVLPEPNSGCWLWIGSETKGYGKMGTRKGVTQYAHRVSFEMFRSAIPNGQSVLHSCDNTYCVNPDHLFCGTHHDNMADMFAKGRQPNKKGESQCKAVLTNDNVLAIRASSESPKQLAATFGVARETIYQVLNRRTWKHV